MHAVSSVQGQGSRQRDERASKTRLLACIRLREHPRKATRSRDRKIENDACAINPVLKTHVLGTRVRDVLFHTSA